MDKGIDCASHQGTINWPAVAASGVEFAYVKFNEGTSSSYPTSAPQFNGATAAGLVTGGYHYGRPTQSPITSAAAFAKQLKALDAIEEHLPPCLDIEVGSGVAAWVKTFIAELRRLTGSQRVMIYSGVSFFKTQLGEGWMDPDLILWLAHYGKPPGQPGYMSPRVAIHQYSDAGKVPGITGNVDLNVAIWPLEQILGDDVSLTPRQDAMLTAAYQYLTGSADLVPPGEPWPGWPTLQGGTDESLSATDYARRANTQLNALAGAVAQLKQQATTVARPVLPPQLSAADVNRIAAAVVALLESKK